MRYLIFMFFAVLVFGASTDEINTSYCMSCHREQHKPWSQSWHSNNSSELYQATIEAVAKKEGRLKAEVLRNCANCHNPTLSLRNMDNNYLYSKVFDIQNYHTEALDEVIANPNQLSTINCYVCHKIDTIKENRAPHEVGVDAITWINDSRLFVGPYDDDAVEFHRSEKRDFFTNSNDLCSICHNGIAYKDNSGKAVEISSYNTADEILDPQNNLCVDCHMSKPFESVASSGGSEARVRQARSHLFSGAHDIKQVRGGVLLDFNKSSNVLKISNQAPHLAPSGFGGRLIELQVSYKDKNDAELNHRIVKIGANYEKNGRPALQYLADIISLDTRLAPKEERIIQLNPPKNAGKVEIRMFYYYMNPSLIKEYDIKVSQKATGPVGITGLECNLEEKNRPCRRISFQSQDDD